MHAVSLALAILSAPPRTVDVVEMMTSKDPAVVAERERRVAKFQALVAKGVPPRLASDAAYPECAGLPGCSCCRVRFILTQQKPEKPKPEPDEYLVGIGSKKAYEEWQRKKSLKPDSILRGKVSPQGKPPTASKAIGKWAAKKDSLSED